MNETDPRLDGDDQQLRCVNCGELLDRVIIGNRLAIMVDDLDDRLLAAVKRLHGPPRDRMMRRAPIEK